MKENTMREPTENKMGTMPIGRLLMSMSLPAMFSMLIQALYNVVDSIYVAQIGEHALTAVSLAFPIQNLMIAVSVGTGVGLNSLISRRLGERREEEASHAAIHGVLISLAESLCFVIFGLFFCQMFFSAFTDDATVIQMGVTYTSIVTVLSFGSFIQICLEKTLQATGNMFYPMVFQLIGAITNIILDPILIFGWFGLPAMGVTGAAVATVAGQILAMLFAVYVIIRKEHAVHITFKGFRFSAPIVCDIFEVGFPSIIMQSIGSVMIIALNNILIVFSQAAVAVLGVYFKLQSFVFMPVFGLGAGAMPIMGYNFGARDKKRLMHTLRLASIIALGIMVAGLLLFQFGARYLLMMFNASEEMMSIGISALRTISLCFPAAALGIAFSNFFQAIGEGKNSLFISVLRQLVILLPCAWLISRFGTLNQVWLAFPIAETVSFFISLLLLRSTYRRRIAAL
jgi:putative MATE family efflux protein